MSLMLPTWHPKTKKELPRGENKPQINGMDCETFYFTGMDENTSELSLFFENSKPQEVLKYVIT